MNSLIIPSQSNVTESNGLEHLNKKVCNDCGFRAKGRLPPCDQVYEKSEALASRMEKMAKIRNDGGCIYGRRNDHYEAGVVKISHQEVINRISTTVSLMKVLPKRD